MSIIIKSPEELAIMKNNGQILAIILESLKKAVQPGIKTEDLNMLAEELINKYHVQSSFKNYRGYPSYICTSLNEEVVHSIPSKRVIHSGDIISIDCGIFSDGFHVDATVVAYLEPLSPEIKKFLATVEQALQNAINIAIPGNKVGDISFSIESTVKKEGYSPVKELTGHGVGRTLHEPPPIPNFGKKNAGPALVPGMTIAIEPIVNFGERYIETLPDGWTIVTRDRSPSIQIEHTIAITKNGNEILTKI